MKLYGIVIGGVFPPQLVTVTDSEKLAGDGAAYLNKAVGDWAHVERVDSFWPEGFVEADHAWLRHYDKFLSEN